MSLFDEGRDDIAARTGWPCLGVVPWFQDAWKLPAEDMMDIRSHAGGVCKVAVPQLERMANFDDLDPLSAEPGVTVEIVPAGRALPGDADLVLLPGSKSTIGDLAYFRAQGWDIDLYAHVRRGGHVLGLCGGYQMLGKTIADPDGVDGRPATVEGLGLLNVETVMAGKKQVKLTSARALPVASLYRVTRFIWAKHKARIATEPGWTSMVVRKGQQMRRGVSEAATSMAFSVRIRFGRASCHNWA